MVWEKQLNWSILRKQVRSRIKERFKKFYITLLTTGIIVFLEMYMLRDSFIPWKLLHWLQQFPEENAVFL